MSIPVADVIGVPTYYVDTAIPEKADNGNVRVINCVTRNGLLIPQFEVIIHSAKLIVAAREVAAFALELSNSEQLAAGAVH